MKSRSSAQTVSILRIPVVPGAEEEFARAFAEIGVFDYCVRHPGFRSGRVLQPAASGEPFVVIAEWDRPVAYDGWLEDPVRGQLQAAVSEYVSGEITGAVYFDVSDGNALSGAGG